MYNELGRHTPPPPPYSLSKRDTTRITLPNEVSQRPVPPPPPPPYLTSTRKSECTIPSIADLQKPAMTSDDSYVCRNSNSLLLPPVPPHHFAAQASNSQQSFEDYPSGCQYNWRYAGVSAHPVEPKWTPGYPGPPLGPATARLPQFSLQGLGNPMPQSFPFCAGTRIRPDHENWTSQIPSPIPSGHDVDSRPNQPPARILSTVAMIGQQPLHKSGQQSGRDIALLANIITNDATRSPEPFRNMCPLPILPSQQAIHNRATLTPVPTSEELDAGEIVSNVKSLLNTNEDSNSDGDPSDRDAGITRTATIPKGQGYASPAKEISTLRGSHDVSRTR